MRQRADQHHRSIEAEARAIIAQELERAPATLVDLLATEPGAEIDFQPERLGLTGRDIDL